MGGWVGPRAGLDAVVKRKISSPYRLGIVKGKVPLSVTKYHAMKTYEGMEV
jgi:hypothetical protein